MVDVQGNVNPTFHVVFREDDGTPLIGGSVYWYKASDHSTLKNVWQDRDRTTALPNPTPLNAAGIVSDNSGAPKPVYLEDDENYFVAAYRAGESPPLDTPVQTVDDWNADNAFSTKPQIDEIVTTNYIPNAQFRTLVNAKTLYSSDDLDAANAVLIARDNWYFRRDILTSTNTLEFKEFVVGQTDVPFNPKYYLNFACSVTSTETIKDVTVDIGDVETFSNQEMTVAIYAKSSTLSQIEILYDQDFGSGGSGQIITTIDSFQLTSSFAQYNSTFTVADVAGKTVGTDNKFRIRIRMPLNAVCNIDIANGQLNVGDTVLEFDFQPSIMNDGNASKDAIPQPTKSDVGKSLTIGSDGITNLWFSAVPVGVTLEFDGDVVPDFFLRCDHSSISGIAETVYANLYDVIGNKHGYGTDGFFPLSNSNQINIYNTKKDTNVTDITDGTTGFTFSTETNGSDLGFLTLTRWDVGTIPTLPQFAINVTNKINGNVTDASAQTSGFTITVAQQGTGSSPEVTYITPTAASGLAGKYFFISSVGTDYYVWFVVSGSGVDPAIGGRTGIKVELNSTDSLLQVYGSLFYALGGCEQSKIITVAASTMSAGDYFLIYNSATTFVPWYRINNVGTEPSVIGTKFPIDLDTSDTSTQVATKTTSALARVFFQTPKDTGYFVRGQDDGAGVDPDAADRYPTQGFTNSGDSVGTLQEDEFKSHLHGDGCEAPPASGLGAGTVAGRGNTLSTGGNETRPINIYRMKIIKY
jgi:hypothetical protein